MKNIVSPRADVWPTPAEIDLLHAAVDDGAPAREAWDRWRMATGGVADRPSRRLLPLVEWNLRRSAAPSEPVGGFVEHGAIRSREMVDAALPALEELRAAGIRVLVIKGLALAHGFYPHPGLRAMSDIDLLVSSADFDAAQAALIRAGWEAAEAEPELRRRHLHGLAFRKEGAPEIDLHARSLAESAAPDADSGFFSRAQGIAIADVPAQTLSAADHLLVVCVHGLRWSTAPAIHWVADALMILRSGAVSWETLCGEAELRGLQSPLVRAFRLLADEFAASIPRGVVERLAAGDSPARRRELEARMTRPSLSGGLLLHWRRLAQERRDVSLIGRAVRFPAHLRELWALDHAWQVPTEAIRKSFVRLTRKI